MIKMTLAHASHYLNVRLGREEFEPYPRVRIFLADYALATITVTPTALMPVFPTLQLVDHPALRRLAPLM